MTEARVETRDPILPPPGLPVLKPCLSIWQRTTRTNPLLNHNSNSATPLPPTADAVIIGSGLSGTLTAYELLTSPSPNAPESVVLLEAREACSGATGRNAGHCRPDAFRGYTAFSKIHGEEQAYKILQHEKVVLELVNAFVEEKKVECDWDYCKTFDVVMGEEFKAYVEKSFEEYVAKYGTKDGGIEGVRILNEEEAKKETLVPQALSAYEWTAANLHPAKLCLSILQMCLDKGLQLYTQTPVTSVSPVSSSSQWTVSTPRGSITTNIVIHATNAFAATLIPDLREYITPTRAQAHTLLPPTPFPDPKPFLTHTYSLRFALHHFYSLIQRKSDGHFILGTSREIPGMSDATLRQIKGGKDDRVWNKEIQDNALNAFWTTFGDRLKSGRRNLYGEAEVSEEALGVGEGHQYGWTGVLGVTKDSVPFIGKVPDKEGQWVIAGFNGHGMARIFGCALGLIKLILGGVWADTGMPECFEITSERLEKLKT
ncbi:FAD dependent oxidoreductase [Marasmius fiardii PR-910]|nr:FAD dependent oxidoreductase [Marasmius fiardii PR-910]